MSTKNLELPYICINCAEHPTNVPGYFNPSLKSNFNPQSCGATAPNARQRSSLQTRTRANINQG